MKKIIFLILVLLIDVAAYPQKEDTTYRVNPGDVLEISVYDEKDLEKVVRVSEKGDIVYPFIGSVRVEGLTAEEIAERIDTLLDKDYFVDANINVFVKEHAKFFVLGEVNREGAYELKGPFNLIDAVSLAGGTKENADLSKIQIIRESDAGKKDLYVCMNTQGRNFLIKPFDRIIVKSYGKISILGEVENPGSYYYKQDLGVVEAIAMAGGFTDIASRNKVKVIRKKQGKQKIINVPVTHILKSGDTSRDVILQEGDTIVVPESLF